MSAPVIPTSEITEDTFSLTFEGSSQMEAGLLGTALCNTSFVLKEAAASDPAKPEIKLVVQTLKKGSISIFFQAILDASSQLSNAGFFKNASDMFSAFKGMLEIKALLKGNKPKLVTQNLSEGTVYVKAPDGTEVTAPLGSQIVIKNPAVDRKITELAQVARLHNSTGGIRLSNGNDTFSFNKDALADIEQPLDGTSKVPYEKRYTLRTVLPIHKIDLLGNASWSFKYNNKTINAKIEDDDFLTAVHDGRMSYTAGDCLDVDILIIEFYSSNDVLQKTSYTILKVYSIRSSHQLSLNLEPTPEHQS